VDVLKIDRSFISQMGEHGDRSEIVRTILGLARTLGMKAVAEGTETLQQADELRRLACDFGQGWLFSKALDAEDLGTMMHTAPSFK
jgi:EAL domain-containing protein (putative c-di-GMP-specific phosphodiesterase class I)